MIRAISLLFRYAGVIRSVHVMPLTAYAVDVAADVAAMLSSGFFDDAARMLR